MRAFHKNKNAFTMVELLVVMAIIVLIASIMLPAIGSAKKAAMRSKARADIKMLHTAIMSFKNAYDRYPLHGTVVNQNIDINYYEHEENAVLIETLRGDHEEDNPRGISFIKITEGSLDEDGSFVDPWAVEDSNYGAPYYAMVDSDYDGEIEVEIDDEVHGVEINTVSNHAIAVWSLGDQEDDNPEQGPFTSWGGEFVESM